MKTSIKKVLLIAVALVFFSAGASFAQGRNPGHDGNKSRRSAQGQFHKKPAYRSPNFRSKSYAYRNPGYAPRHYYRGRYYPRKNYRHFNNYRHYHRYPTHNSFFFSYSVR